MHTKDAQLFLKNVKHVSPEINSGLGPSWQKQVDVSVEDKVKLKKVDLHIPAKEAIDTTGVDWESLAQAIENLQDKDAVKSMWNARKEILDAVVPESSPPTTLREVLIQKVASLS